LEIKNPQETAGEAKKHAKEPVGLASGLRTKEANSTKRNIEDKAAAKDSEENTTSVFFEGT